MTLRRERAALPPIVRITLGFLALALVSARVDARPTDERPTDELAAEEPAAEDTATETAPDTVPDTVGDTVPDTVMDVEVPAYAPLDVDVNELARRHAVRVTLGFAAPMTLGGLTVSDRERVFQDGATEGDSAVHGAGVIAYRRGLLDVRLGLSGKALSLVRGSAVVVDDGVEEHTLSYDQGGGYFSLQALAGVTWEPTLYTAADGNEGLSLSLSALGGFEHISLWGSFRDERIPNYRHPEQSFHWIVERQRVDAELALHWRHFVGGRTVQHLLGIEAGVVASLLVHIPGISYASDPISGATDAWGTYAIFVRLSWELALPAGS